MLSVIPVKFLPGTDLGDPSRLGFMTTDTDTFGNVFRHGFCLAGKAVVRNKNCLLFSLLIQE